MAHIVAPHGSPLAIAVISCVDLEASLRFYRDVIGLDATSEQDWNESIFAHAWPKCVAAGPPRACLLSAGDDPVGRVLLVQFGGAARGEPIARHATSASFGLNNLNFYVRDARTKVRELKAQGFAFWSEPTQHSLTAGVGNPIEVIFDGPDSVAINLVELVSADPTTRIGQMRAFAERNGFTRTGYTAVVTTSHGCRDIAKARRFYEEVLGMGVLIDEAIGAPHVNAFLRIPDDARTHLTFMQGNHMYGKIALAQPLNYADRCDDLAARAVPPNVGYLAQAFEVSDVDRALQFARTPGVGLGVDVVVDATSAPIPGLGVRRQALVRNPGSGALQWLIARN